MACISADGKPTGSGIKILRVLKSGLASAEEIARATGLPPFRVRSGLREFAEAGLAVETVNAYEITDKGRTLTQ